MYDRKIKNIFEYNANNILKSRYCHIVDIKAALNTDLFNTFAPLFRYAENVVMAQEVTVTGEGPTCICDMQAKENPVYSPWQSIYS